MIILLVLVILNTIIIYRITISNYNKSLRRFWRAFFLFFVCLFVCLFVLLLFVGCCCGLVPKQIGSEM